MRPCGVRYFRRSVEHTATAPCSVIAVKIRGLNLFGSGAFDGQSLHHTYLTAPDNGSWPLLMIGFGPVSRPPPRRAAVMRAGANGPVGGGSTSENHRMPDVWPHRNRLLSRPFPLAGSSSKVAKSPDNVRSYRLDTE